MTFDEIVEVLSGLPCDILSTDPGMNFFRTRRRESSPEGPVSLTGELEV